MALGITLGKRLFMQCSLCNKKNFLNLGPIVFDAPSYYQNPQLVRCKACGMVLVSPPPNEKKLAQFYKGDYHYRPSSLLDQFIFLYNSKDLFSDVRLIEKYIGQGRVLDIGAGRGDFLLRFPENFWERWAFDPYISDKDARSLSKKIGSHVNDYSTLDSYPDNFFDAVVLRNVIEHTAAFTPLLKKILRVLKKGGTLFIRTPNVDSLEFKLFKNNWFVVRMTGHIVFFGKRTMRQTLRKIGFKRLKFFPTKLAAPLSLFRSLNVQLPKALLLVLSLVFSGLSLFWGQGTDLRAIAKK